MGALVAAAAALSLLVVAALSRPRASAPPPPAPSTGGGGAGAPPSSSGSGGGDVPGAVAGALGAALPVVAPLITTLVGGGTAGGAAAVGGATTGGVVTSSTVATSTVTGTGTGTAAASTTAAVAGVGGSSLAASIAGPGIIVGVVLLFIIADKVVRAQENDKDWQSYLLNLNANANGLNRMEAFLAEAYFRAAKQKWVSTTVRDFRMDRLINGTKTKQQGWAEYLRPAPLALPSSGFGVSLNAAIAQTAPVPLEVKQRVRGIVFRYLRHRARHAYALMKAWNVVTPPADWGVSQAQLFHAYEDELYRRDAAPGDYYGPVGGLLNVPSAFGGQTVTPRQNAAEPLPHYLELVGNEVNGEFANLVTDDDEKVARFLAICETLKVLRWDPRPGIEGDGATYASNVLNALQHFANVPGGAVAGLSLVGEELVLDPATYGVAMRINPRNIKLKAGGFTL